MNLFDFTNVQKSITDKKKDKFIFNYCILNNLGVFPEELVLVILHLRHHYMKHQLSIVNNVISCFTDIGIIGVKFFKLHHPTNNCKSYNLFPNNILLE